MKTTALRTFVALAAASFLSQPAMAQAGFTTLYNFTNGFPTGLTLADGGLYGSYAGGEPGGSGCGNIFFLQAPGAGGGAWTETVLYTFADTNGACYPLFAPLAGPGGVLYGVAQLGGANQSGALYELMPPASPAGAWTESILYSFYYGENPASQLVPGPDGSFYEVSGGGVIQLLPPTISGGSWTGVWLGISDWPISITPGPHGSLYATSIEGTFSVKGSIVRLIPPASPGGDWTQIVIHSLADKGQGGFPNSLAVASDGTLYGTTYGTSIPDGYAAATVFKLTPPASPGGRWTYTMLENFGAAHLLQPPLILRDGKLFSAIVGSQDAVIALTPPSASGSAWTLNYLHTFTGEPSGYFSIGPQVMDGDGTIYGATQAQGESPTGTVYRIVP
jgi:hypothetical protein